MEFANKRTEVQKNILDGRCDGGNYFMNLVHNGIKERQVRESLTRSLQDTEIMNSSFIHYP